MHRRGYLETGLELSPAIFWRLVGLLGPSRYDEKLSDDRFTVREIVAHMADLEPVIRGRIELALASPGAAVPNFDQDAEAIAKNYSAWDVVEGLSLFAAERAKTVDVVRGLTPEQERLSIRHALMGEISALDLATFALGHDTYHVDQLTEHLTS